MNEARELIEKGYTLEEGLALLKKYSSNDGIISVVQNRRSMKHLAQELGKLARLPRLKPVPGYIEPVLPETDGQVSSAEALEKETPETETTKEDSIEEADENADVVTYHDLTKRFKNTKYDDMPTDFLKGIYKQNTDKYKELQYCHQQMKLANCDEGRAKFRADVLRLNDEVTANWKVIDEEIERLKSEPQQDQSEEVNVSTLRSYITRQLKKIELSAEELVELKRRVEIAQAQKLNFSESTLKKLNDLHILG